MQDAFGVERGEISKREGYGWESRAAQKKEYKRVLRDTSPFRGPNKGRNAGNIAAGTGIGAAAGAGLGAALTPGARRSGAVLGGAAGALMGGSVGSSVNHARENNKSLKRSLDSGAIRWADKSKGERVSPWTGRIKVKNQ